MKGVFHPALTLLMAAVLAASGQDPFATTAPPPSKKAADLKVCPRGHSALKDVRQGGCIGPDEMVTDCTVCGERYNDYLGYWLGTHRPGSAEEAKKLLSAKYQNFPFQPGGKEATDIQVYICRYSTGRLGSETMTFAATGDEAKILAELAAWVPASATPGFDGLQDGKSYYWKEGGREYHLNYLRGDSQPTLSFAWEPEHVE